jgi:hypothetical protein
MGDTLGMSSSKFPGNREKNREFFWVCRKAAWIAGFRELHAQEQGINREFRNQALSSQHSAFSPETEFVCRSRSLAALGTTTFELPSMKSSKQKQKGTELALLCASACG